MGHMTHSPIGDSHEDVVREEIERHPDFAHTLEDAHIENRFGLALAELREQRDLSQRALADLSGIKQPMIARLERGGQTPTVPTVFRLMRALKATCEIGPEEIKIRKQPSDSS